MSSFSNHIPDHVYDKTHIFFTQDGEIIFPPRPPSVYSISAKREHYEEADEVDEDDEVVQTTIPPAESATTTTGGGTSRREYNNYNVYNNSNMSILLSEGLRHHVTGHDWEDLPPRVKDGSVKARFTWFGALCMAGIGMFVEAYIIITTGQIKTVWRASYPACFEPNSNQVCPQNIECCGLFPNTPVDDNGDCALDTSDTVFCTEDDTYQEQYLCHEQVIHSISYSEFAGIMLGMLFFGMLADKIGRNATGILTSVFMMVGITMMTFVDSDKAEVLFLVWSIFFGIFGLGVGGEYPLSASGAADYHTQTLEEAKMDDDERRQFRIIRDKERTARRGETIGFVFAMQGIGAVTGSIFLLALIYFSDQSRVECNQTVRPGSNSAGVNTYALNSVWRSFYFIGEIFVLMVLLYRWLLVDDHEDGHSKIQKRKERRTHKLTYRKIISFYWNRLIGTGGCWFVWDMAFYGLKLFSGPIFADINPAGDLAVQNGYILINNVIALVAYYIAARIIDIPTIGRKNVQAAAFMLVGIIFLVMSSIFENASSALLIALFFLSSFVGQFVNTTTFVLAAETYPAELRGTLHGLSSFMGKAGALFATIIFGTVDTPTIFLICGIAGLIGALLTIVFSVNLTHVSLSEHDAQLELFLEGQAHQYKGKLNQPKHLSLFERWTGWHGEYDPDWAKKLVASPAPSEHHLKLSGIPSQHRRKLSGSPVPSEHHRGKSASSIASRINNAKTETR